MGIPVGTTYTSTLEATFVRRFTCTHCGFESLAKVRSRGEGQGTSPLWLREQGAKDAASAEALRKAEEAADELVALAECPSCERHDEGARSGAAMGAWLGGLGLGVLCAALCYFVFRRSDFGVVFSAIAGVVATVMHVKSRAWRWNEIDDRVRVLRHSEVKALLKEHDAVEADASGSARVA
jgi:hypothetical protein